MSPEQLLRELEGDGVVVADLEAGIGTVLRLPAGGADVALVVAQPTAKSLEVARRALEAAAAKAQRVIVVANRVRSPDDAALIAETLGRDVAEVAQVPDDAALAEADAAGFAPLDTAPDSPGVRAILALAGRV